MNDDEPTPQLGVTLGQPAPPVVRRGGKLTDEQIKQINLRNVRILAALAAGRKVIEVAKEFGVSTSTVNDARRRQANGGQRPKPKPKPTKQETAAQSLKAAEREQRDAYRAIWLAQAVAFEKDAAVALARACDCRARAEK